jgi:sterol 3beta-glucosyltransferase
MASDTGREFMQAGGANPLKSIQAIRTLIGPVVMDMAADAYAACRGADAIICLGVFSAFGHSIAEALDIPLINLEPTPLLPTKAFPAPSWPIQKNWGGLHNFVSGQTMLQVVWYWYRPFVNAFRRQLGLPALNALRFARAMRSTPLLGAYSPNIIPHPADWPESVHITACQGVIPLNSPRSLWKLCYRAASGVCCLPAGGACSRKWSPRLSL